MIILGQGALARPDGAAVLDLGRRIADAYGMVGDGWNGFNVLHTAAARVGGLDLGFVPGQGGLDVPGILAGAESGDVEMVFLLHADELDTSRLEKAFVVYQGSHGDEGVRHADVILPGATYTEKNATWINTEGRVQLGARAVFPPGDAREDWTILRALSEEVGHKLPYDTLGQLRARIADAVPHATALDDIVPGDWGAFGQSGPLDDAPFASTVTRHYLTNPICRASVIMAECTAVAEQAQEGTGTHG
jgi:NADH-quinone oxidoreductase subunit G